jgi:hypothetical protein
LAEGRILFRIAARVGYSNSNIQMQFFLAAVNHIVDIGGHLPPDDCPDKAHQSLRLAQVTPLDRVHHN